MQSQAKMAQAMGSTAQVMGAMNKQLKVEDIQRTMASFEQESTKMDMAGEMSKDILIGMDTYIPHTHSYSLFSLIHTPSSPSSPHTHVHAVDDTLDSLFDDDEGEEDAVMSQILDEIGIEVNKKVRKKYFALS